MEQKQWSFMAVFVYSMLNVFLPDLTHPYNDLNSIHARQGFSWRPESVSFGTIDPTRCATRCSSEVERA